MVSVLRSFSKPVKMQVSQILSYCTYKEHSFDLPPLKSICACWTKLVRVLVYVQIVSQHISNSDVIGLSILLASVCHFACFTFTARISETELTGKKNQITPAVRAASPSIHSHSRPVKFIAPDLGFCWLPHPPWNVKISTTYIQLNAHQIWMHDLEVGIRAWPEFLSVRIEPTSIQLFTHHTFCTTTQTKDMGPVARSSLSSTS